LDDCWASSAATKRGTAFIHREIKLLTQTEKGKDKCKAIPLQAWKDPEVSRRFRLPDFMTIGT
jgi:hypothetical protein